MCCNNRDGMFIWLALLAGFIGLSYFGNFFSSLRQTLSDPSTWFIVILVIIGSLMYKWSSRRSESPQH